MRNPIFLVVDLFCGAGGTTTGFVQAQIDGCSVAKVIACVNHDHLAIKSHWANHPDVKHFEEDIRTLELAPLAQHVLSYKNLYPGAKLILWASLECTNFSKAKGGKPRDADSRTLADHLHRYIHALDPDYIMIENVVEFMSWGPLDKNGKPVSRKNGTDWLRWRKEMCAHGYLDDWKEMNSADFGAYTSRNRLFGIFARPGLPVCWPEPTHSKKPAGGFFSPLKKWKPVKEVLDFSDEGTSIFDRKKPLSEKTLERIYAGLVKFVANGDTSFLTKYFSGKPTGKNISTNNPAGAITAVDHHAYVQPVSMLKYNSTNGDTGKHIPPSLDSPSPVISTQGRLGLVFLAHYYSLGGYSSSIESPCPTVLTKDRTAIVMPEQLSSQNQSIEEPAGTVMPNDKHRLIEAVSFLMPTSYDNMPKSIHEPSPTIQASRRHHYIVNPSHGGHCTSTNNPCPVIVARQDKAPLYLILAENGPFVVPVYQTDSPFTVKIKQFMAAYGIVDIKMRMLRVRELLKIQGFPENYQMCGNQTDQKKFIGNSVVPVVVKMWVQALSEKMIDFESLKIA